MEEQGGRNRRTLCKTNLESHEYNRVHSVSIPLMITNESLFLGNAGNNLDKMTSPLIFCLQRAVWRLRVTAVTVVVSESKGTHRATEPFPFFLSTGKTFRVWPLLKFSGLKSYIINYTVVLRDKGPVTDPLLRPLLCLSDSRQVEKRGNDLIWRASLYSHRGVCFRKCRQLDSPFTLVCVWVAGGHI